MHVLKILRTYYISSSNFDWVFETIDLSASTVDRYSCFPIVNLHFVGYARTTKSNKWMSKCNENIEIDLHNKVGLVLLCTQHSIMYYCVHSKMQLCPQHIPQSHEYCQFWT